ncbi:hypothetical protein Tco_0560488 [Tanacetum coccineum]
MAKYVKDYKIILEYVKHGSSIFVTPKKGVAIAVDNHLRNGLIEIDLTPMCHRNLTKEWEQVTLESVDDPFEDFDEILSDYVNTREQITKDEITGKHIVVHIGVGPIGKFKEVEVDADNESEEDSNTKENYTSGSDSEDSDYDPKHDEVFDDDEHIVEDVHVSMNNFSFTADPKHDLSIGNIEVQEDDLDIIDYDLFGSDLDDGIDFERRIQLSPCPGQILTAVRVDANNGIYPVEYAIVEAESKASWCWFLKLLGEDLGIEVNFNYTFISDRQKVEFRKFLDRGGFVRSCTTISHDRKHLKET